MQNKRLICLPYVCHIFALSVDSGLLHPSPSWRCLRLPWILRSWHYFCWDYHSLGLVLVLSEPRLFFSFILFFCTVAVRHDATYNCKQEGRSLPPCIASGFKPNQPLKSQFPGWRFLQSPEISLCLHLGSFHNLRLTIKHPVPILVYPSRLSLANRKNDYSNVTLPQ